MRSLSRAFILAFLCFFFATLPGTSQAQADEIYYHETRHYVRGDFLAFFQSVPDPLLVFGYPISEEMIDPITGQTVQYFQRARLDQVKTADGDVIEIAPLGQLSYDENGVPFEEATNPASCRYFPDSGHSVCYAFLRFYDLNDGATLFGSPISDIEIRDNRYVQYFDNVRMEWRPEMPAGQRVVLSDLGRLYYDVHVGQETYEKGPNIVDEPVEIQAHAFVGDALTASGSNQSIYVIVQDLELQPVQDAMISISVYFPDGTQYDARLPMTNADGISEQVFPVGQMPVKEIVRIDVTADYQGSKAQTGTWFRIWY